MVHRVGVQIQKPHLDLAPIAMTAAQKVGNCRNLARLLAPFPDFEQGTSPGSVPFRLDRTRALLDMLGRPDRTYRKIHVVGTKGKGSTTAMLDAILTQAGQRVGMFTSPHLLDLTERFQLNGAPAKEFDLAEIFATTIWPAIENLPIELGQTTYFEVLTLLALQAFAEAGVDVAIIEAGLGGRLDSTNAISPPDIVTVVPISLDHTQILGSTAAEIARDKTEVFKAGSVVVAAKQTSEVATVIAAQAQRVGCEVFWVNEHVHVRRIHVDRDRQRISLLLRSDSIDADLPLAGPHQAQNAATASLAASILLEGADADVQPHQEVSRANDSTRATAKQSSRAIRAGLESVQLRGRFEYLCWDPVLIVDVAHNEASAKALAATIVEAQAGKVVYVVGLSHDKDAESFFRALTPTALAFVCVRAKHPRARDAEDLAGAAGRSVAHGQPPVEDSTSIAVRAADSVEAGMKEAREFAGSYPVVVTGSFYVASEAIRVSAPLI